MKTLLAIIILALASCVTTTETRPDGTVIKTESIDHGALAAGSALAQTLADRNSGK